MCCIETYNWRSTSHASKGILCCPLHSPALQGKISRRRLPTTQDIAIDNQEIKREWRATITFSLLFLTTIFLSLIPGLLSQIVGPIAQATDSLDSVWFYLLNTVNVNLFLLRRVTDAIFIIRNRDIKDALAKLKWLPPFWYTCSCRDVEPDTAPEGHRR